MHYYIPLFSRVPTVFYSNREQLSNDHEFLEGEWIRRLRVDGLCLLRWAGRMRACKTENMFSSIFIIDLLILIEQE